MDVTEWGTRGYTNDTVKYIMDFSIWSTQMLRLVTLCWPSWKSENLQQIGTVRSREFSSGGSVSQKNNIKKNTEQQPELVLNEMLGKNRWASSNGTNRTHEKGMGEKLKHLLRYPALVYQTLLRKVGGDQHLNESTRTLTSSKSMFFNCTAKNNLTSLPEPLGIMVCLLLFFRPLCLRP